MSGRERATCLRTAPEVHQVDRSRRNVQPYTLRTVPADVDHCFAQQTPGSLARHRTTSVNDTQLSLRMSRPEPVY